MSFHHRHSPKAQAKRNSAIRSITALHLLTDNVWTDVGRELMNLPAKPGIVIADVLDHAVELCANGTELPGEIGLSLGALLAVRDDPAQDPGKAEA